MNERFARAPHHNERSSAPSPNAALLIDFDNVTMGIRSNLGQELRQLLNSDIIRGKVSVQRAYADWRRYPQYVVPLSEAAIDLIYAPAYGSSKKNATDIRLAIDALELVFTRPEIGSFILLSGDSDFSSLVLKLKEYGKYVIGVGMQESSSDLLVQNCDEYYSYDSLSGLVSADEMDTDRHDPWELCEHSIKKMVERDDVMRSDRLKQVMLELDPSFDEKEIGYSKFNRFLTEASSRGLLKLEKIGNGQYRVGPGSSVDVEAPSGGRDEGEGAAREADGGPPPPRDLTDDEGGDGGRPERDRSGGDRGGDERARAGGGEQRESRGGERSRGRAGGDRPVVEAEQLRSAYDLLREVVGDLSAGEGRVRDSEVKREMLNRDSSFDEGALGFSKFSRFIRQAHDEEVVDVAKDSDGNYYLRPPGGAEPAESSDRPSDADEGGRSSGGEPERARDESDRERRPEPEARERARAGSGEQPSGDAGAETAGAADRRDEPTEGPEEPAGSAADGGDEKPSRRGGGLRRRRKSSGSGGASGSGDDSWVPGPVDAGDGDDGSARTAGPGPSTGGSAGDSGGRRGLGRFRRGRKSGAGAAGNGGESGGGPTPGPVSTEDDAGTGSSGGASGESGSPAAGGASEPDGADAAGGTGERPSPRETGRPSRGSGGSDAAPEGTGEEIVAHMKDHYSGVGEKTARKLVEEFGEETMEVIDRSPERVENLLPKHRAEAVLQARAVERDRGED